MSSEKPVRSIVLDAGPILQNNPPVSTLLSKSENIFTSPSIIAEIKDVNARTHFETTLRPFITVKTPSPLSIKFVSDLARKTGDLTVLSRADVEILALTYELEHAEKDIEDQIIDDSKDAIIASSTSQLISAPNTERGLAEASESTPAAPWAPPRVLSSETKLKQPNSLENHGPVERGNNAPAASEEPMDELQGSLKSMSIEFQEEDTVPNDTPHSEVSSETLRSMSQPEDEDSEDSDGWITPKNIKRVQAAENEKASSTSSVKTLMRTAIITTDFAMQNVILQIGLNLLSPNLNRISNIRTYILRCHACFQTVKDTSKQFCPRCGKPTLTRVSCSTNGKGEFRIHLKKNMQWNHRGDRYSIPKPVPGQSNGKVGRGKGGGKGGWGQELILAEDQKEYQRAVGTNGRFKGIDLMDEEYLPGILTGNRGRPGGRPKVGAGRNVNSKKRVS